MSPARSEKQRKPRVLRAIARAQNRTFRRVERTMLRSALKQNAVTLAESQKER